MPNWEAIARAAAAKLIETGVKAVEGGVDSVLEDLEAELDGAFEEGKRRLKQARSRIPNRKPGKKKSTAKVERPVIIDAEIIDESEKK